MATIDEVLAMVQSLARNPVPWLADKVEAACSASLPSERSPKIVRERSTDYRAGDIFIGEFLGDSDLLLIRGDRSAPDYGQVMIALPIDRRTESDTVGSWLTDFLDRYVQASGDKFWEAARQAR